MRISDWSSDVCSSDLTSEIAPKRAFRDKGPGCPAAILVSATVAIQCPNDLRKTLRIEQRMPSANVSVTLRRIGAGQSWPKSCPATGRNERFVRSEEHTSELQSLMRI